MQVTPHSDRSFQDDETPVDEIDELLVSYLDGELDERARRELEDRLFVDDSLRQRLSDLQSGWDMLDHLPQATVTEDFARTTLEMVAAGQSHVLQIQRNRRPWRGTVFLAALVSLSALAAAAGYWIPQRLDQQRFYAELDDLPLALHLDAYLLDVDLESMVALAESQRWNSAIQLGTDAGAIALPVAVDLEQRERPKQISLVQGLDREVQSTLSANWDRLHTLSEDQLRRVRQRHQEVRQLDHPGEVLRTMEQYAMWWDQLSPESKDEIVKAAPEEKLEAILATLDQTSRGWLMNYGMSLSDTDRELIYATLQWIASDRIETAKAYVESGADEAEDRWHRTRYDDLEPKWLLYGMARNANWEFWQRIRSGERINDGGTTAADDDASAPPDFSDDMAREKWLHEFLFGPPTEDELREVEEVMSPKALFVLNGEASSWSERRATLWRWCVEIILEASPRPDSSERMQEIYDSMGPDFRDLLDLRTPDELFEELRNRRRRR